MSAKELLIEVKSLIDTPEKWYQGGYGRYLGETDGYCALCLYGALGEADRARVDSADGTFAEDYTDADILLKEALPQTFKDRMKAEDMGLSYIMFNDESTTTHEDIMGVLDRAIEAAS